MKVLQRKCSYGCRVNGYGEQSLFTFNRLGMPNWLRKKCKKNKARAFPGLDI